MEAEGLWRREEERRAGYLDPDASSTALTAPLQCLTHASAFSCSSVRRPLSLSQPPSSIGGDETLTDRSSLAADGSDCEPGPGPCQTNHTVRTPSIPAQVPPSYAIQDDLAPFNWTLDMDRCRLLCVQFLVVRLALRGIAQARHTTEGQGNDARLMRHSRPT